MPFDSKGNFSRIHNWEDDRINGIEIVTDHMDEEDNNFADGLSQCFLKNGLSAMQNDFDAGNFKVQNVANGVSSKDAVNKSQLDALQTAIAPSLIPTGTILSFGGETAPNGFLLCNGQAVSRTTYSALFAVTGTTFGVGDGSTTFNLPNFSDKFLQGTSSTNALGTVKTAGLPEHRHIMFQNGGNNANITATSFVGSSRDTGGSAGYTMGQITSCVEPSLGISGKIYNSTIYGNSSTVQPPAVCVNYIIKY